MPILLLLPFILLACDAREPASLETGTNGALEAGASDGQGIPDTSVPSLTDAGSVVVMDAATSADGASEPADAAGDAASLQDGATARADAGPADAATLGDGYAGDSDGHAGDSQAPTDPERGYTVGTTRIELAGPQSRTLPVQLWYPAAESARAAAEAGRAASEFEPPGARRTQLETLFKNAPQGCATQTMHAADAPPPVARAELFPLVLMSHCHSGMRFGYFSVAERLASLGFVVAAVDHLGDTMYDSAAGMPGLPDGNMLELRKTDVLALLALLLDANASAVPSALRGKLDAQRVGLLGHSFGSMTAGLTSWSDARIKASVFIAAPPTVLLVSSAVLSEFRAPALFFYASEDNSIPTLLNDGIRTDYAGYPREAWLLELTDAGHFAFSDINALIADLVPGCGQAQRQTNPFARFTYLDPKTVREILVRYVSAFFERTFLGKPGLALDQALPDKVVTLKHHK